MQLRGKTAIITGGAHRLGKSIALMLADEGVNLAIHYFSAHDEATKTVLELQGKGIDAYELQCDISNPQEVTKLVSTVQERSGQIDILINCADHFESHPFPLSNLDAWERTISVSLNGTFYLCNAVAPGMLDAKSGHIITMVDLSAYKPWPKFLSHSVAKAGLVALTQQLAQEMSPWVRVNGIAAGLVLPPTHFSAEKIAQTGTKTLLKRWGNPKDISETAKFLLYSDYITGEIITVDGGQRYCI